MIKVSSIHTTPDAYRQSQFYAGEHLAYYYNPTATENRAHVVTDVENGIFIRKLEKESGLQDILSMSSTKGKQFIEKSRQHASREELMQQLNYVNGVHYSATNQLYKQLHS